MAGSGHRIWPYYGKVPLSTASGKDIDLCARLRLEPITSKFQYLYSTSLIVVVFIMANTPSAIVTT